MFFCFCSGGGRSLPGRLHRCWLVSWLTDTKKEKCRSGIFYLVLCLCVSVCFFFLLQLMQMLGRTTRRGEPPTLNVYYIVFDFLWFNFMLVAVVVPGLAWPNGIKSMKLWRSWGVACRYGECCKLGKSNKMAAICNVLAPVVVIIYWKYSLMSFYFWGRGLCGRRSTAADAAAHLMYARPWPLPSIFNCFSTVWGVVLLLRSMEWFFVCLPLPPRCLSGACVCVF